MALWQTRDETGRIVALGKAAENTAIISTKPTTGTALDWGATGSGEALEGWTKFTGDLSEDDFEFVFDEGEPVDVWSPTGLARAAFIRDRVPGIPTQVRFTSFTVGSMVADWCSNVASASGLHTFDATLERVAIMIEVEGLGVHYMPSCEVHMEGSGGGLKTLATQPVTIDIFEGDSVAAGYQFQQWINA